MVVVYCVKYLAFPQLFLMVHVNRFGWFLGCCLLLVLYALPGNSQSLSFSNPTRFIAGAKTDRAFDITNFKGRNFAIWKDAGKNEPHVLYLGKQYDTATEYHDQVPAGATTRFAPVLRVMEKNIYALWIDADGLIQYIINDSDSSFDIKHVYHLNIQNPQKLSGGITAANINGQIMIASHAANSNSMLYAVTTPETAGRLKECSLVTIPSFTASDYPFVVTLGDAMVRFSWRGYKEENIYYADLNLSSGHWSQKLRIANAKSAKTPAMYHLLHSKQLFYVWNGSKKDKRIYYASAETNELPVKANSLPVYFNTEYPVAICDVDETHFIMAYTGKDQHLYMSYFSNYNPARWMKDMLFPAKANYTLRDIVLPGSHDAGMSVLTAAGGTQSGSINNCNTLTQTQSIGNQLYAGIRMFDLRIGTYKNILYTKHCSSDCMQEAIGGGYGEPLYTIVTDVKNFLQKNNQEIVVLNFSHFCEKETPVQALADSIAQLLGPDLVYQNTGKNIHEIPLSALQGKVIILFEDVQLKDKPVNASATSDGSAAFINWRRKYAATNDLKKLLNDEEQFFHLLKEGTHNNDLVRLDWQLTQSSDEAALVCNDFQSEDIAPVFNGAMFLTNLIKHNQSIVSLARKGNNYLPVQMNEWLSNETINKQNKPNILYVDAAGTWITDYCVNLNNHAVYRK